VIAALVVILLLIAPELGEIGLPGGWALKRRVEQNEQDLQAQGQRQETLKAQLDLLQVQQIASAGAVAQARSGDVFVLAGSAREALNQLGPKQELLDSFAEKTGTAVQESAKEAAEPPTADRAVLEVELLRLVTQLETWVDAAETHRRSPSTPIVVGEIRFSSRQLEALVEWTAWFEQELRVVFATRNALVSGEPIIDRDLEATVKLARALSGFDLQETG
jgi:hypothetical protein